MAKAKKDMTPKERREQLIKDRGDRLAREAAKQGMTPAELKKKKKDTFLNVVGGAATMIPVARVMQLANVAYKGYKGAGAATKVSGAAKTATKGKATTKTAGAAKKSTTKPAAKKQAPKSKAEAAGSAVAAGATKTKRAATSAASKARASANRLKSRATAAAKKPVSQRARNAILGGAATSATLSAIDAARKSGKGKAKAATMPTGPKPRPKRSTGMSEGNTVAGSSGRRASKGPGVGRSDKNDPRKGFSSKPTAGAKKAAPKKVATTKSRDKDGQGTGKIGLPAGAKRKFQGSFNNKTEKLRKIDGKTYVFNK